MSSALAGSCCAANPAARLSSPSLHASDPLPERRDLPVETGPLLAPFPIRPWCLGYWQRKGHHPARGQYPQPCTRLESPRNQVLPSRDPWVALAPFPLGMAQTSTTPRTGRPYQAALAPEPMKNTSSFLPLQSFLCSLHLSARDVQYTNPGCVATVCDSVRVCACLAQVHSVSFQQLQ